MKLYILEGCHGAGKTTFINSLPNNIVVLNEEFCDNSEFPLGSELHQIDWLLKWVKRVIKLSKDNVKYAVSDRGPNTAVIMHGDWYDKISRGIFSELSRHGITVEEILIEGPEDINEHYCRILKRNGPFLESEIKTLRKLREKYSEKYKGFNTIISGSKL